MSNLLRVKVINKAVQAHYDNVNNIGYTGDSGINVVFPQTIELMPNKVTLVDLGICCNMVRKGKDVSYLLMPRSSIAKTPLMMANSIGLIDAGYRGELKAAIRNMGNVPYVIEEGTSLFQIVSARLDPIRVCVVDKLDKTERGSGGFGSTNA